MLSITPSGQEVLKESLRTLNLDKVVRDSQKDNKSRFMRNITGIRALQLVFFLLNLKPNTNFLKKEISLQKGKPQHTCSDLGVKVIPHLARPTTHPLHGLLASISRSLTLSLKILREK